VPALCDFAGYNQFYDNNDDDVKYMSLEWRERKRERQTDRQRIHIQWPSAYLAYFSAVMETLSGFYREYTFLVNGGSHIVQKFKHFFSFSFFVFIVSHLSKFSVVIQIFLFPFICYLLYCILGMI